MKILLLSHEFPPVGGGGGNAVFHLAKELIKCQHDVSLMTCKYNGYDHELVEHLKIYDVSGFRKSHLDNKLFPTFLSYIFNGSFLIRKILKTEEFDIIHSFFSIPAGLVSGIVSNKRNIPKLLSLRGSDVPYHGNSKLKLLTPIIKKIWSRHNHLVFLSNGLLQTGLKSSRSIKSKSSVIYNGVDSVFWKQEKGKAKKAITRFVCVARIIELKGIQDVLQAMSIIDRTASGKFHLTIVGDGPYLSTLQKWCTDLKLNDFVRFAGYKNKDEIKSIFSESDAFILCSYAEAFGQVFTEALSSGLPVIGSRTGGIPEIINPKCGILVEPGDYHEIAHAMKELSEKNWDKELIMKQAKRFSWKSISEKYLETYKKLQSDFE